MQQDRKKRPPVERTDPVRIWQAKENPESRGDRAGERPDGGRASPFASDAPDGREASYKAVNEAYRLIDEYVRQGQKMAEDLWLPAQKADDGGAAAPLRFMR